MKGKELIEGTYNNVDGIDSQKLVVTLAGCL